MKLVWPPLALERVSEIAEYIARDRPAAAEQWVESVFRAVKRLQRFPLSGREVPEDKRRDLREVVHEGYRIVYRVEAEPVSILTVRYGRQLLDPEEWEASP